MALTQLITDPDSFLERKMRGRQLRWEFVLVLVIGGLGAPGIALVAQSILDSVGSTGEILRFTLIGFAAEPVIGIFLVWFGYAVTANVLASRVFNGRGPIRNLLKSSAWALVPIGIGNLARTVALYFAFADKTLESESGGGPLTEQYQTLQESALSDPVAIAGTVVLIVTVVVSGYLFSIAIEHAKDLPEDDARKVAAVPVGAFVLYLVAGFL